jgi:hypothetical protein
VRLEPAFAFQVFCKTPRHHPELTRENKKRRLPKPIALADAFCLLQIKGVIQTYPMRRIQHKQNLRIIQFFWYLHVRTRTLPGERGAVLRPEALLAPSNFEKNCVKIIQRIKFLLPSHEWGKISLPHQIE